MIRGKKFRLISAICAANDKVHTIILNHLLSMLSELKIEWITRNKRQIVFDYTSSVKVLVINWISYGNFDSTITLMLDNVVDPERRTSDLVNLTVFVIPNPRIFFKCFFEKVTITNVTTGKLTS